MATATKRPQNLQIEVRTITPQEAGEMLAFNKNNRSIRAKVVDQYARDMASGSWAVTGESIKFNGKLLIDGQHRLLACISANKPFTTLVVKGLEAESQQSLDGGSKRNLSDRLRWLGHVDTSNLASTITLCWRYDNNAMLPTRRYPTGSEALAYFSNNSELVGHVKSAHRMYSRERIAPVGPLAAGMFLFARDASPELAEEFYKKLDNPVGLSEEDPILALRRWCVNAMRRGDRGKITDERFAVIVKAFNAWANGVPLKQVKWNGVGNLSERFPIIQGPEK